MKKIFLVGLIAVAVLLAGASAVLAQDGSQTTPLTAINQVCLTGGISLDQMKQMHDAMGQNVPEGMQQMHDAMGQALQNGDAAQVQQVHNTCQTLHNAQP
ncbi:MAG: hypothetical protein M1539_02220 [Actinobacteria bacterium]|nr:hypothetical protein [Actinomycetota bacterium]